MSKYYVTLKPSTELLNNLKDNATLDFKINSRLMLNILFTHLRMYSVYWHQIHMRLLADTEMKIVINNSWILFEYLIAKLINISCHQIDMHSFLYLNWQLVLRAYIHCNDT